MNKIIEIYNYMGIDLSRRYFHQKDENLLFQQNRVKGIQNVDTSKNTYVLINNTSNNKRGKAEDITTKNAFYLDIDVKKNGKHIANNNDKKAELFLAISSFPIPPTLVNETENGYHIYWAIADEDKNMTNKTWTKIEQMIFAYTYKNITTLADSSATDVNRILKVPGTYAYKQDSASKFLITVKQFNPIKYHAMDIYNAFFADEPIITKAKATAKSTLPCDYTNDNIEAIKHMDYKHFRKIWGIKYSTWFSDYSRFESSVKCINTLQLLGIEKNVHIGQVFSSIMRKDKNPSCVIFRNNDGYCYFDHGTNVAMDNVQIIMDLAKCSKYEALNFIAKIYNAILDKNETAKKTIKNNKKIMKEIAKQKEYAKGVKNAIDVYELLLQIWEERVNNAKDNANAYEVTVEAGAEWLANQMEKKISRSRMSELLSILENIGLIYKVKNYTHEKEGVRQPPNCYAISACGDLGLLSANTVKKNIDKYNQQKEMWENKTEEEKKEIQLLMEMGY